MRSLAENVSDIVRNAAWVERQKDIVRRGKCKRVHGDLKIPAYLCGKTLENFDARPEFKQTVTEAFFNSNVFLWGGCGAGKTHFSKGVVEDFYARMMAWDERSGWQTISGEFVSCSDLIFGMKEKIGDGRSDYEVIERLLDHDALVLDDYGAVRLTDYAISMHALLIDKIYRHKRAGVLINSNHSLEEIAMKIDDRTASRIAEMCTVFKLEGKDRRLEKTD
jgi:DNA replication protein DnaC